MEVRKAFDPGCRYPLKASFSKGQNLQKVAVISNHFAVRLLDAKSMFVEWFFGFVHQSELEQFKADPHSLKWEAVPADSRYLIEKIFKDNRRKISADLGRCFITGNTLFSVRPQSQDLYYYTDHKQYVMVVQKKNSATSLEMLQSDKTAQMQYLRFLNSSVKSHMAKLGYKEIGANKKYYNFDKPSCMRVGDHKFIIFKGYKTRFEVYESGIRLMIDYNTRIIRDRSLWEEVEYYRHQGMSDTEIIEELVVGRSFLTIYGSQRIFRIDSVRYDGRVTDPFPNPSFRNYAEYFREKYKIELRYKNQFLLVHRKKIVDRDASGKETAVRFEEIVLLPELVKPTGLTDEMRKDFRLMKDIGEHTIVPPEQRFDYIDRICVDLSSQLEKDPEGLKMKIDRRSNEIRAIEMRPPRIITDGGSSVPNDDRINLSSLAESRSFNKWVMFYEPYCERNIDTVIDNFYKSSSRFRVKFSAPSDVMVLPRNAKGSDVESMIRKAKNCRDPDMIFFFVSRKSASFLYREMKKHFGALGVATQFFVSFNPNKDQKGLSKFGNLLLQMINKIGCNLWYVDRSLKNSMVMGTDCYNGRGNRSVSTVVSQFDEYFKKTYSTVSIKSRQNQEIMNSIAEMILANVENYVRQNKQPPANIVIYRNGVSQGQVDQVVNVETQEIVNELQERYGNQRPKVLVILVTLRNDARFADAKNRVCNPRGGLVVLDDVVSGDRANFFMIAQKVTQGTANPTHYDILYNETSIALNDIISLTFELTWSYHNWLGPVKVPAPLQYATKLSELVGITMSDKIGETLKHVKYYM